MNFDEFVTTTTENELVPAIIDTILESNVLTMMMLKNTSPWTGAQMEIPVKVSTSGAGGSYNGYDLFSTTRANTRQKMTFNPTGAYQSVVVSGMEKAVNMGSARQAISLIAAELQSAKDDLMDKIGTMFYSDGTGNSGKDFQGLAAAVDDGSVAATYGGLSRATYTTLQSNVTTSVGNLTLAQMATMYDSCQVGSDAPTLIVTTPTVWTYYESLLQPTVVANYQASGFPQLTANGIVPSKSALNGDIGFDVLYYRGTPVVKDEKCTAGYMYFLNMKYLKFYNLARPDLQSDPTGGNKGKIDGVYSQTDHKAPPISWTGFKMPVNQDAEIGQFIINGEIINKNPNRSGVLQGITGV